MVYDIARQINCSYLYVSLCEAGCKSVKWLQLLSKNSNIGMDTVKWNEIKSTLIICDNKYCSFEYGQIISVH